MHKHSISGTPRTRACSLTLSALLAFSLSLVSVPAGAILGKDFLGTGVPCLALCGSDGIINTRFFGDVTAKYLTGPSIDAFGQKMDASIDRGLGKLDKVFGENIEKLDALAANQRIALVRELDESADFAIDQLSTELDQRMSQLSTTVDEALDRGDILTKVFAWRTASTLATALFAVLLVACLAGFVFYLSTRQKRTFDARTVRHVLLGAGTISLLCIGAAIATYAVHDHVRDTARRDLVAQYEGYKKRFLFFEAASTAAQLTQLDPNAIEAEARALEASILRDVFAQPARYLSDQGRQRLMARIDSARLRYGSTPTGYSFDLEVLAGMLAWQTGEDRIVELAVASTLANLLEKRLNEPVETQNALAPLAVHYLKSYLSAPLSEGTLERVGFRIGKANEHVENPLYRYRTIGELSKVAEAAPVAEVPVGTAIESFVRFGDANRRVTLALHSALSQGFIILANAREQYLFAEKTPLEPNRFDVTLTQDERNRLGETIDFAEAAWGTYVAALANKELDGLGMRASALRVPHHFLTYIRLWKPLLNGAAGPAIPVVNREKLSVECSKHLPPPNQEPTQEQFERTAKCWSDAYETAVESVPTAYTELLRGPLERERWTSGTRSFIEKGLQADWVEVFRRLSEDEFNLTHSLFAQRLRADPTILSKRKKPLRVAIPLDPLLGVPALTDFGILACGASIDDDLRCDEIDARAKPLFEMLHLHVPELRNIRLIANDEASQIVARRVLSSVQ